MIAKLEKQMTAETVEKAYCDDEMSKTQKKYDELEDSVASLTADIDTRASKSSKLKEEVSELESQLAIMAKEQGESDRLRRCEKAAYEVAKKDLEEGLAGVKKAMMVLREYYGTGDEDPSLLQDNGDEESMSSMMQQAASQPAAPQKFEKATGAGGGILAVMEVIESDLAKNLATEDTQESDSVSSYEKTTQSYKVTKAEKEQDIKYKTQEYKALDKSIAELMSDKATDGEELSAVTDYFEKLKERCIAKPSSYEERKAKREAEIQGLKEALAALENDALLQSGKKASRRGQLRGNALSTD
jgi:chromosome segregation ATPase